MSVADTPRDKKAFLKVYPKNDCNIRISCEDVGIVRSQVWKWRLADKKFAQNLVEIEQRFVTLHDVVLEWKKESFLESFQKNACNISKTCDEIGIYKRNFYAWSAEDEKFKEAVADIRESVFEFVENAMMKKIQEGYWPAIRSFLVWFGKHKGYVDTPRIEEEKDTAIDVEIVLKKAKQVLIEAGESKL